MPISPASDRRERWLVGVTEYAGLTGYTGGIGRHYASLLPAFQRLGVDVGLVVFADDVPDTPNLRQGGTDVLDGVRLLASHRRARGSGWLQPLVRAWQFRRDVERFRPDRVFLPEWAGLAALVPKTVPLVTNLATSIRLSNEVSGVPEAALPRDRRAIAAVQSWCEDRQMRRSDGVVPISRAMLERTGRLTPGLPEARVVRNCIDVEEVRAAADAARLPESWPDDEAPILLFLGRLERKKGVEVAVRAFAELVETHPTARLVLAGSSGDARFEPTRQDLVALVPEAARDRVVFLGHVEGPALYRGIRSATAVLCPSLWEGFGQVALEAKALGSPVVVTTGSGFDDFCTDDADSLMVAPGDVRELARAAHRLLADPALRLRLAERATAEIGRFTADAVAPDVVAAVRELS